MSRDRCFQRSQEKSFCEICPKRLGFRCLVQEIFLPWQGEMTSNSWDYCEEFQRSQGENNSAIKPKPQSFWV